MRIAAPTVRTGVASRGTATLLCHNQHAWAGGACRPETPGAGLRQCRRSMARKLASSRPTLERRDPEGKRREGRKPQSFQYRRRVRRAWPRPPRRDASVRPPSTSQRRSGEGSDHETRQGLLAVPRDLDRLLTGSWPGQTDRGDRLGCFSGSCERGFRPPTRVSLTARATTGRRCVCNATPVRQSSTVFDQCDASWTKPHCGSRGGPSWSTRVSGRPNDEALHAMPRLAATSGAARMTDFWCFLS